MKYSITLVIILAILLFIIDFDNSFETLIYWWLPLIGIWITGMLVYNLSNSLKKQLKIITNPLLALLAVIIIAAPVIFLIYNGKELYNDLGLGFIIVLIINILIAFAFIKNKMN